MRKIILCVLFECSYFFLLAIIVPTVTVSTPSWLEKGAYAKYRWETRTHGDVTSYGFHSWEVVSINREKGSVYCVINETRLSIDSENNTEWRSSILEVEPNRGYWLNNYFNEYISVGTCFIGDTIYIKKYYGGAMSALRFSSIGTMQFNNASIIYFKAHSAPAPLWIAGEDFRFDICSGLLLRHDHYSLSRSYSSHERIVSTNIPLTSSRTPMKTIFDLTQLAPLIGVPLVMFRQDIREIISGIRASKAAVGGK